MVDTSNVLWDAADNGFFPRSFTDAVCMRVGRSTHRGGWRCGSGVSRLAGNYVDFLFNESVSWLSFMIHFIPPYEEDLHTESEDCPCEPKFEVDAESGEMCWIHLPLKNDELLENFIQI